MFDVKQSEKMMAFGGIGTIAAWANPLYFGAFTFTTLATFTLCMLAYNIYHEAKMQNKEVSR